MCSINEDGLSEFQKKEKIVISDRDLCRKCKESNAKIVLREKDLYCNSCFLEYFTHKFRSTIGKSKMMKPGDKVLVAFSGKLSSFVLLHLLREGIDDNSHKNIRFIPSFLYIDDSLVQISPPLQLVQEEITRQNFPFYSTTLQEILRKEEEDLYIESSEVEGSVSGGSRPSTELECKLKNLMDGQVQSSTSRDHLISILRLKLICRVAKQLGFNKVFLADNGTELAVRILSDVALGRGAHLTDRVNFHTVLYGMDIYRPMRELFEDELQHYIEANNLNLPFTVPVMDKTTKDTTILSCTEDFVMNLQKEFVSTVPTVFKTGGKLVSSTSGLPSSESLECNFCNLCGSLMDQSDSSVTALDSILFSKKLCQQQPYSDKVLSSSKEVIAQPEDENKLNDKTANSFCYSCSNLMHESGSLDCFQVSRQN